MRRISNFARFTISTFFPKKCICCGEIISENKEICNICRRQLALITEDKRCHICGNPKKYCECKYRVFYFEGCISVFENRSTAKQSYYRYKLSGRPQYSRFFTKRMAAAVKHAYKEIKFDAICPVPTSPLSIRQNGFDHTLRLARELSGILNIPLEKKLLGCRMFKKPQHGSDFKSRRENVRGKYYIKTRADGKNILLVDDIRTTGSTLSECSHMLLLAGANSVYCVTALTTIPNKDKQKKNGDTNGN